MAFTSRLATDRSRLAAIKLAADEAEALLEQSVSQTIVFVDSAVPNFAEYTRSGADTLDLAGVALATVDRFRSVSDVLEFTEELTGNFYFETVEQTIEFVDSAETLGPTYLEVASSLALTQEVDGHLGVINIEVDDVLDFVQVMGRQISESVSDTITFTDEAVRRFVFVDTLTLFQTATGGKGKAVVDTVTFTDAITTENEFSRSLTTTMALTHAAAYLVVNNCLELNYSPFVGTSTDASYTPPTTTAPTLSTGTLTLTYPYVSPTSTIVLRNPRFGNRDRLTFNRINRETRGGTLIVFADPAWPKIQALSLQLSSLKQSQITDLNQFLADSLGKEIGLLDWENRQWRGVITNPDTELSHDGRTDRGVTLEFEGELA